MTEFDDNQGLDHTPVDDSYYQIDCDCDDSLISSCRCKSQADRDNIDTWVLNFALRSDDGVNSSEFKDFLECYDMRMNDAVILLQNLELKLHQFLVGV